MLIQFYQQRSIPINSSLYVIGNTPELGSWDPKNAIKMQKKNQDIWSVEVSLSQDTEYKYLEISPNQIIWDQGQNRKIKYKQQLGQNDTFQVMSFNIRYETEQDEQNKWGNRKQYVSQIIQQSNCDFIGLQEVLFNQYQYLTETLESYNSIGRGRGHENWNDEGVPIFYDLRKWKVIDSQIFWLSNNPNQAASTSYGNQIPRICTWIKFKNLQQNQVINVYNCHLDHISGPSQQQSAKQIKNHIQEHVSQNEFILLMGDFNSLPVGKPLDIFCQ